MPYTNNKGADQPAYPRCLDSMIPILAKSNISRLWLVSVAVQASLSPTKSQSLEDRFSHDMAHLRIRCLSFVALDANPICNSTVTGCAFMLSLYSSGHFHLLSWATCSLLKQTIELLTCIASFKT